MIPVLIAPLFISNVAIADYNEDVNAIKKMAGCYEVSFEFKETESLDPQKASKPYKNGAVEWVALEEKEDGRLSLQHILTMGSSFSMKHWRQEWQFEGDTTLSYQGFNTWSNESVESPEGSWVQKVYQIEDSPRYECSAMWEHGDSSKWECATWAPLPRREYSKRSDYQVTNRGNVHEVTKEGWLHRQNNEKLRLEAIGAETQWVASELGLNTYKKVDEERCSHAKKWWSKDREGLWAVIHDAWQEVYDSYQIIKVDDIGVIRSQLNKLVEESLKEDGKPEPDKLHAQALEVILANVTVE